MNKYSASLFNFLFNSTNSIVAIINGIVLVPIYFKFMSISTYGAWLATGNIVAMIGLMESGFASVITQKMSEALGKKKDRFFIQLASANLFTGIFMSILLFLLGLLFSPFIADWINADISIHNSITIAFIISLASSSLSLIVSFIGAFPQVWHDTKITGLFSTIVNIIGVISLIIFLYLGFGVVALALGHLTRSILNFLTLGIWVLLKWKKKKLSKPKFNISVIKMLLKDSFYPFLNKISSVIMGNSQNFILAFFISPSIAAVYDITSKIAVVSCNFVGTINSSFFGFFSLTFASKNNIEINKIIKNVYMFFTILLVSCLLYALVFTKPFVHFLVGLDKYGGNILLYLIVFSILISQLKNYFNSLLYSGGLINKSAILDIISMLLYIIFLLILINPAGIYAIPIAISFSGILFIGMYLRLLKKYLFIDVKNLLIHSLNLLLIITPFIVINYFMKLNLLNISILITYVVIFSIIYISVVGFSNKKFINWIYLEFNNAKNK